LKRWRMNKINKKLNGHLRYGEKNHERRKKRYEW